MFDNLGDDFPFDWLVKHFQKEILLIYLIAIQEIVFFLPCFFLQKSKNSLLTLYMCIWPILT